jgi:hypothetical protein
MMECVSWLDGQCIKYVPSDILHPDGARSEIGGMLALGLFALGVLLTFVIAAYTPSKRMASQR